MSLLIVSYEIIDFILTTMFILIFFPVILRLVIGFIITLISRYLYIRQKTIRLVFSLIAFPGTILRIALIFLFLGLRGWRLRFGYTMNSSIFNRNISTNNRGGFYVSMVPGIKELKLKDLIILSVFGYLILALTVVMWEYQRTIIDFLIFILYPELSLFKIKIVFYYLIFSFFIGGIPIPEESLAPIFYMVARYPHLIFASIIIFFGSIFITLMDTSFLNIDNMKLAYIYFLTNVSIYIIRILVIQREYDELGYDIIDSLIWDDIDEIALM